jgi:hypothetical protein
MSAGTLYRSIQRMIEQDLIVEVTRRPAIGDDSRRRYYRISLFGRAVARAEMRRLTQLVRLARARGLTPERLNRRLAGAIAVGILFVASPQGLLGLFGMTEPVVAGIGVQLLRFLSGSVIFITVALVYTGGLQGTGDTRSPLYISIISQIVVPLGICYVLQETRGLEPADIWLAILLGHMTRWGLSVVRFRQGKWRRIVVDIEPGRS